MSSKGKNILTEGDFEKYPSTVISNGEVKMRVYLPDPEKGIYCATRFDWSGVIGSVQYKGHEYFGYWKNTHDPFFHEDIMGPAEGFNKPGLGYDEAEPGGRFIRIGVGIIEKADEANYNWMETYKILDHGKWEIEKGEDYLTFTHTVYGDMGYGYIYKKTIQLKSNGFTIKHTLQNTGVKTIETDQFNHNFLRIDHEESGPNFEITYPYAISTERDLKGLVEIKDNTLSFSKEMEDDSVYLVLDGYSDEVKDNQFTVVDKQSGCGLTFSIDQPLFRVEFWAIKTTLCPENHIEIVVEPDNKKVWKSEYTLFVK